MGTDLRGVLTRRSIAVALRARADLRGDGAVSAAHATAPGSRLLSVEEARAAVLAAVPGPTEPEIAYLSEALGRVLAEPVISTTALPPWDNSAMDGYAIRAADVDAATEDAPVRLEVIGDVAAGKAPDVEVRRGTAVRIATGAPIPAGATAVVPVEATTPLDADGAAGPRGRDATGPLPAACLVHEAVPRRRRRSGGPAATWREGVTVLEAGRTLSAQAVALAAGAGVPQLTVHRRPRVAVLATGDEVVPAGQRPGSGRHPRRERPGRRGARRRRRRGAAGARDREGPARGRRVAAVRRPGRAAPTRSSSRAACRSGRTTS